jgi:hypothetical protein
MAGREETLTYMLKTWVLFSVQYYSVVGAGGHGKATCFPKNTLESSPVLPVEGMGGPDAFRFTNS